MNIENPYAPPRAAVSDVADSPETSELAGRGIRLGAYVLDSVIASALIILPFALVGGFSAPLDASGEAQIAPSALIAGSLGFIVWAAITIRYVVRNGQSIAKKLLGIKVVRTDGSKASLGRIFWLRNVVNAVLGMIPFYGLIDALVIFSESRQCIHDKLADTIVVMA
jgi:uncharacterized RDD family membrane protein YckC